MKKYNFPKGFTPLPVPQAVQYGVSALKRKKSHPNGREGFTLMELMIVFALLGIFFYMTWTNWQGQISKAYDAQRKGDLSKIRVAMEHYINDHGCYPTALQMSCGATTLESYNLSKIPCDPESKQPYFYDPDPAGCITIYRLYTTLKDITSPTIAQVGCNRPNWCNAGVACPACNYGVSNGVPVAK